MNKCKTFSVALLLCLCHLMANANVRLPSILSNHMVVQQKSSLNLWGWSDPAEDIQITTSWDTVTHRTSGSAKAKWQTLIQTPAAGGPHTITIKANNVITITDILVGEVWLCSGQSNMEMSYNWLANWKSDFYIDDVAQSSNPRIRFFNVTKTTAEAPQDNLEGRWEICEPSSMKNFSLVGYFFGQKLHRGTNFPVGLIGSSWGGTPAEVWIPRDSINNSSLAEIANKRQPAKHWTTEPGTAFNAMIYPITQFKIAGALWYQGESNVGEGSRYTQLLNLLIRSWRSAFSNQLPFYYVQIAPYEGYGKTGISSALTREAQSKVLTTPGTAMTIIHDLVDNINDIHPRLKKEVGFRLASIALADAYNLTNVKPYNPKLKTVVLKGNKAVLTFDHAESGLIARGDLSKDFYVAGEDKIFRPATAQIKGNSVTVISDELKNVVAVRYGFSNAAMPVLFNKEGLPADIFRTDNWDNINTLPNDVKRQ